MHYVVGKADAKNWVAHEIEALLRRYVETDEAASREGKQSGPQDEFHVEAYIATLETEKSVEASRPPAPRKDGRDNTISRTPLTASQLEHIMCNRVADIERRKAASEAKGSTDDQGKKQQAA